MEGFNFSSDEEEDAKEVAQGEEFRPVMREHAWFVGHDEGVVQSVADKEVN